MFLSMFCSIVCGFTVGVTSHRLKLFGGEILGSQVLNQKLSFNFIYGSQKKTKKKQRDTEFYFLML